MFTPFEQTCGPPRDNANYYPSRFTARIYRHQLCVSPIALFCFAGGEAASVDAEPRCTAGEKERLVAFGMQMSRLGESRTVVDLMSRGVDKQPLRSPVGLFSTGGAYANNAECTWLIAPPNASNITVEFGSFETEESYDFVEVYDGSSSSCPMLASLTGVKLPLPITSTSGSMFVRLISDFVSTRKGFTATYRADNAPPVLAAVEEPSSNVCLPAGAKVRITSACRSCILATIASVCGKNCVQEQLHIVAEPGIGMPSPSPCLPALRTQLMSAQAGKLRIALTRCEPFGLTCGSVSDLYIPSTPMPAADQPSYYVGLDTGYLMASCDPRKHAHVWVITRSTDRAEWEACRGELWIDMRTGEARSEFESGAGTATSMPMLVHSSLSECFAALRTVPMTSDGRLSVGVDARPATAACWLQRFFGPQVATIGVSMAPSVVEMEVGLDPIVPLCDVVVRAGQRLTFLGNGVVLQLGDRQVRVMRGGELTLDSIVIVGSAESSALVVEGKLVLRNSTVRSCSARMNVVSTNGLESRGGGIYVSSGSALEVLYSRMVENVVREGMHYSEGGAIYVTNGSNLTVVGSELAENVARDGGDRSSGGAIAIFGGSMLTVATSTMRGNVVERGGSQCYGGAVHLAQACTGEINNSTLSDNVARSSGDAVWGGAVMVEASSSLKLGGSRIERNVVESGDRCSGGGMTVANGSSAVVADTEFVENSARDGSSYSTGGGIYVRLSSSLHVINSSILNNSAIRGKDASFGGAIGMEYDSTADVRNTELLGNSASDGARAQGGAFYLYSNASARLLNGTVVANVAENADVAEGGACYLEHRSNLLVINSSLCSNSALDGVQQSRGGALSTSGLVTVELVGSQLFDNTASSERFGASAFGGALDAKAAPSTVTVVSCSVGDNAAMSSHGLAAGGGFYTGNLVTVDISGGELRGNRANGATAEGGGVWFTGDRLHMSGTSVTNNTAFAHGTDGRAAGGALFDAGVSVDLVECLLVDNTAAFTYPASQASGGAVYAGFGSGLLLLRCVLRNNRAGYVPGASYPFRDFDKSSSAVHVFSQGLTTLDGCVITDDIGLDAFTPWSNSAWFWIISDGGSLELRDSRFGTSAVFFFDPCKSPSSGGCDPDDGFCPAGSDYVDCGILPPPEAGPYGRLLNVRSTVAQVVVRSCVVTNLTLHATVGSKLVVPIGVVNSTFEPPLNSSLLPLVQPDPNCAAVISGAPLCDPRSACERRPSGGVQCACIGEGVQDKPGTRPDGQQCEQHTRVAMVLQSQAASVTVSKPSNGSVDLRIVVRATGESRLLAAYNASAIHRSATGGGGMQPNSSRIWSRLDEARLSLDGHHVSWSTVPPANDSEIALDASAKRYAVTKEYAFQLGIDCRGEATCVADGDTVETVVEVGSESDAGGARSAVRITTLVEALISCAHSQAWIENDLQSVPASTAIRVHLDAYDVDRIPIAYTLAPVEFRIGSQLLPQRWDRGSNHYVAEASADVTSQTGQFELVVTALKGWSDNKKSVGSCVLLSRSIEIVSSKSQLILAGCLGGIMVLMLGMLGYLLYRKKERLREVAMSFLAFEGLLVLEMCLEAWVRLLVLLMPSFRFFLRGLTTCKRCSCVSCATGLSGRCLLLPHLVQVKI